MHEAEDAEIPAIIWAVALVVVVTLLIFYHAKAVAARKVEIRKLQRLAAEELARAEEQAEEELSSILAASNTLHNFHEPSIRSSHPTVLLPPPASTPVVKQQTTGLCAVCSTPTKKQCSRCKAVKYCSHHCQVQHWRDGHKQECREQEKPSISRSVPSDDVPKDSSKDEKLEANGTNFEEQLITPSKTVRVTTNGSLTKPSKVRQILFPYEDFVELFAWDGLSLPPCGLINCGNSCFANVVLQCLTYTRPLTAYLLQGIHSEECKRSGWCFMCELQTHVSRVQQSQNPFSPIRILSQIRNIGNHLGYGRQEDAHEFMRFAVDSMQSACLDKVGGEKAVDHRTQETTLIQHIFGGHLQSQVRCMQCHHESHRYENMMDLAVEIHGNVDSLEDALTQFTAPEWLDGENKYKCDRCTAYVKAWKRLVIHEAPNILTIALKRFQSGKFGKLNKRVSFPEILDISPYMSGEGDKPPLYQLYGVIVHVDMLNASFFGHYICYVKDLRGCWYKMDDSKVKEVDIEKVLQQRAYMLLYSRSAARLAITVDGGIMGNAETGSTKSTSGQDVLSNGNYALPDTTAFTCEADRNGSHSCLPESNGRSSNGDSGVT